MCFSVPIWSRNSEWKQQTRKSTNTAERFDDKKQSSVLR